MAFTQQDVVDKACILGGLNTGDAILMERVDVTAEMMISKASTYIGYDSTTVDALLMPLAEMTAKQTSQYQNISKDETGLVKQITRGDYSVQYDFNANKSNELLFNSYEWILKKYKKLRMI